MSLNEDRPSVVMLSTDETIRSASWAVHYMRRALILRMNEMPDVYIEEIEQKANSAARDCWESLGGHFNVPTPIQAVRLALAP